MALPQARSNKQTEQQTLASHMFYNICFFKLKSSVWYNFSFNKLDCVKSYLLLENKIKKSVRHKRTNTIGLLKKVTVLKKAHYLKNNNYIVKVQFTQYVRLVIG